jgi:hypothetical protein
MTTTKDRSIASEPVSAANLAEGWGPDGFAGGAGRTRVLPVSKGERT